MMNPRGIESNVKMTVAQPNPKSRSQLKNCAEMKTSETPNAKWDTVFFTKLGIFGW